MPFPDLNLLIYLHHLIQHGSVTQVAHELGVSQPAVSAGLRRLRALLNDPVMVRAGGKMVPTAKALAVHGQAAGALQMWRSLGDGEVTFDPARTSRSYSILASDYIQFLLIPALARELAQQAPHATLRVIPSNPYRRLQMVVEREADLAIGYYHGAPEDLRARRLFVESMVCVMRKGHPAAKRLDRRAFLSHAHVAISSVSQGSYSASLEQTLAAQGIERTVALTVPSYLSVPEILLQTDHLALLPTSVAQAFSSRLDLVVRPSPLDLPLLDVSILYHNASQDDASHRWIRQLVVQVAAGLDAGKSPALKT
jgi:DNA-binding transcriptional LysR family regulator